MIYLVSFFISTLFGYYAYKKESRKKLFILFSMLSILVPSLVAGLRVTDIGTDVNGYLVKSFNIALNSRNISLYNKVISSLDLDLFYRYFVFIVTKVFKNINMLLFCQHLFICTLFYIGAYYFRKESNPVITFLLFLLLYFNLSLNIMRQFCSLAIIFFSFRYIKERNIIKYLICVIIASLFHSSASISIIIYFIHELSFRKMRKVHLVSIIIVLLIVLLNYNKILLILNEIGIIPTKYFLRYSIKSINDFNFNYADMFIKLHTLFLIMIEWKSIKKDNENFFYLIICVFDLIISQTGSLVSYASRMSIYFGMYNLINTSRIISFSKINKKVLLFTTILLYVSYFVYVYIIVGACETYPYISIFHQVS